MIAYTESNMYYLRELYPGEIFMHLGCFFMKVENYDGTNALALYTHFNNTSIYIEKGNKYYIRPSQEVEAFANCRTIIIFEKIYKELIPAEDIKNMNFGDIGFSLPCQYFMKADSDYEGYTISFPHSYLQAMNKIGYCFDYSDRYIYNTKINIIDIIKRRIANIYHESRKQ